MNSQYDVYMCRTAKAAAKTITRGNIAALVYRTSSDAEKKVMHDVYEFLTENNYKLVIKPKE